MSPLRSLLLWASTRRWLGAQAQKRAFTRRAVRRFLPGEDLDAAILAAEKLAGQGSASVFHELGENVGTDAEADAALQHYQDVIERAASRKLEAHVSVKLTHLGLDLDRERARDRIDALAGSAAASRGFIWMDMEGSAYTDATLDLYRYARERHDSVGICLQSYLFRTGEDLERLLPLAPWVRLVKGAYRESASVAHARKRDVDRALVEQSGRLLSDEARAQGARLALASHDVRVDRRGDRPRPRAGSGPGRVRDPDALRNPDRQAAQLRRARAQDAGADQLRRRLVPLVHASTGRAAGQRLVPAQEPGVTASLPGL